MLRVNQLVNQARRNGGRLLMLVQVADDGSVSFMPVEAVKAD